MSKDFLEEVKKEQKELDESMGEESMGEIALVIFGTLWIIGV